jgi:hypothetical protein
LKSIRAFGGGLVVIPALLLVAGCSEPEPVTFRVIYSTDIRGWIEPCT